MSVKSKQSSKKSSTGKKERKKKVEESDEDFESSDEELDLTKECHPIGYYLNDRAEMIDQMFSVIKGNKLKAMLPPILKDCDIEQLKLQCLDQLLGMSDRRITCILEGESLETSSESEVIESDECDSDAKNGTTSGSHSERSNDSHEEHEQNDRERQHKKRKGDPNSEGKLRKLPASESEPEQGKTLLEILELEMRARAIRALLKQSSTDKGNDQCNVELRTDVNEIKEVPSEVVDLTQCEDDEFPGATKKEITEEIEIEKKVLKFEEKIEKSKVEKPNQLECDKFKRLQAELEIRNKLFKKKIYRTRQQRMESEEEERGGEKNENEEDNTNNSEDAAQKQVEPAEVTLEDPEEGEVSTSEDECPAQIKQEPQELELMEVNCESNTDENVTNFNSVTCVGFNNFKNNPESASLQDDKGEEVSSVSADQVSQVKSPTNHIQQGPETNIEETSWRDRWLQKDGVQKLVKSSKIYAKVKKRIAERSQKAKEDVMTLYETNSDSNSNSKLEMIEGSIEEYEKLLKKNECSQQVGAREPANSEAEKT